MRGRNYRPGATSHAGHLGARLEEEIRAHCQPYQNDESPHTCLREPQRIASAEIAADKSSCNHDDRLRPVHRALHNEDQYSDTIDGHAQDALESVHGVDIRHAYGSEHGEIDDAHSASEITAVSCDA